MGSSRLRRGRIELVSAAARLGAAGLILPGEGNLSLLAGRGGERRVLVTPAGVDKSRIDPQDAVEIPWPEGARDVWRHLDVPARASTEVRMHLAIYEELPETKAIVHAHPPGVLALSRHGLLPTPAVLYEGEQLLGSVGWLGDMAPGSLRLAQEVASLLVDVPACVLERHGAVTRGASLEEALRRMLLLERLAELTLAGC